LREISFAGNQIPGFRGDDGADIDSTDAHIEGNVFMNFHGGGGQSLEIIDPTAPPATWNDAESRRAAAPSPGTP